MLEIRNPFVAAAVQFGAAVVVAVLVMTVVWGDPLVEALQFGAVLGVVLVVVGALADRYASTRTSTGRGREDGEASRERR